MRPAVWVQTDSQWAPLAPVGFVDEAALHDLIELNPALLPLSGAPQLVVLGREVSLGSGSADLLAIEANGRLVVIEVKLAYNPEARRAIVSQVLSYAAYLHGSSLLELENRLAPYLRRRYSGTLDDACAGLATDLERFHEAAEDSLSSGQFRLVLVLDSAPPDLIRLVGYLETVADHVIIDLVQVNAYQLAGSKILVPQRVDPERAERPEPKAPGTTASGEFFQGPDLYDESINSLPEAARPQAEKLREWAATLAKAGLTRLESYRGPTFVTLLPRLIDEGVGPVTIYNDGRKTFLGLYRQVLERRSPNSLTAIEAAAAPAPVGRGTSVNDPTDELLAALTTAYREAAGVTTEAVGEHADTRNS